MSRVFTGLFGSVFRCRDGSKSCRWWLDDDQDLWKWRSGDGARQWSALEEAVGCRRANAVEMDFAREKTGHVASTVSPLEVPVTAVLVRPTEARRRRAGRARAYANRLPMGASPPSTPSSYREPPSKSPPSGQSPVAFTPFSSALITAATAAGVYRYSIIQTNTISISM